MKAAWASDECPQRGPGLTHTMNGAAGSPCIHCGVPLWHRDQVTTPRIQNVTIATATDVRALYYGLFGLRMAHMNPDAPEKAVVTEDPETLQSACSCHVCRWPEKYNNDPEQRVRAWHIVCHREFDEFLRQRDAERLAGLGIEVAG